MNTAICEISKELFFELLGFKNFDGDIENIFVKEDTLLLKISGNDYRLPEDKEYSECNIICTYIQSKFEKINKD